MRNTWRVGLLGLLALGACGDNAEVVDDGPLGTASCVGRTLDDADLIGIYNLRLLLEHQEFANAVRIDPGDQIVLDGRAVPFTRDGDHLRAQTGDTSQHLTVDLAGLTDDCTLTGTWQRCVAGQCYDFAVTARKVVPLDEPRARGLTLLGEYVGTAADPWTAVGEAVNVRVVDHIAYVATYGDGLRIVDVRDPAHPVELGHVATELAGEIYNDVKLVDAGGKRYALAASDAQGVLVIDVTDPGAPFIRQQFAHGNVHTLFVVGARAYLAAASGGLAIWDITNPPLARQLGTWAHPADGHPDAYLHDLSVDGDRAYLSYWSEGMTVLDVADPAQPVALGDFAGYGQTTSHSNWVTQVGARKLAVHGDEQWGAHVHIVDVTESTAPFLTSIGEWQTRPEVSVHNIMAFGDRAYLAHYQDGVRVLDLSDPTHPTPIAWFDTWPGYDPRYGSSFYEGAIGLDVDLDAKLIYVADTHRGLLILRLDI